MQTIDLDALANVTGGTQQQAQPQSADPATASPQGAAPAGGNFLQGLQQFLGFFQSEGFQQLIGSLQGLLGQLGQGSPAPQAQQPQAQA